MVKFDHYYYKDEGDTRLSIDWFTFEDRWIQRYMFDRPMHDPERMEETRLSNLSRYKWFTIRLNLFYYKFLLDIRLKKVGNVFYGRVLQDIPKTLRKRKEK